MRTTMKRLVLAGFIGLAAISLAACTQTTDETYPENGQATVENGEESREGYSRDRGDPYRGTRERPTSTSREEARERVVEEPTEPDVTTVVVPAGTEIPAELDTRLDSGENHPGDKFTLTVTRRVSVDGHTAIPAGATIHGTVTEVASAGRPQKSGRMEVRTNGIEVGGEYVPLDAVVRFEGEGSLKEDLGKIGIGAGVGAALGAIIEGDEGAVIGGIIGAGGTFLATKGEQVELEPGMPMEVELERRITVPVPRTR